MDGACDACCEELATREATVYLYEYEMGIICIQFTKRKRKTLGDGKAHGHCACWFGGRFCFYVSLLVIPGKG
jgi:hypothetical protein